MSSSGISVKIDKTRFENIKFDEWKKLIQNVLNYDLYLSGVEKLEEQYLLKAQLEAFINCRGVIPAVYQDVVNELNAKYDEARKIRQEIEITKIDGSSNIDDQEKKLKEIEKELQTKVIDKGKVIKARKAILYFQNPYFLNQQDQLFVKRLPSLKNELKNIEFMIKKELKPKLRKNLKMLHLIEYEFRRILKIKDDEKDIKPLFYFVRPYIEDILTSENFYYNELLALSTED